MKAKTFRKGGLGDIAINSILQIEANGMRAPRVMNDRAGEVGRTLNVKDFDIDRIFGEEGAEMLHISGLIAALSHS